MRNLQIKSNKKQNKMSLKKHIREISNFPKAGISFKDITPILINPTVSDEFLKQLILPLSDLQITKVIGIESRGFFFGTRIAASLNVGFVPVRKKGKLPFQTFSASYDLEYGQDVLEMHIDAIQPGDRVVIHDDVLATGGTAEAVAKLVEKAGGEIVQFNFMMELSFLNGREKINSYPIFSVVQF